VKEHRKGTLLLREYTEKKKCFFEVKSGHSQKNYRALLAGSFLQAARVLVFSE